MNQLNKSKLLKWILRFVALEKVIWQILQETVQKNYNLHMQTSQTCFIYVYSNKKDQYTPTMTLLVKIKPWNLKCVFNYDSRGMSHVEKDGKLTK